MPNPSKTIFVIDLEAYHERYAIVSEDPEIGISEKIGTANACGYATQMSKALTAAANGDWEPAKEMCRRERDRAGEESARELMRFIQATLKDEIERWQMFLP